jgi:hypothetical protein
MVDIHIGQSPSLATDPAGAALLEKADAAALSVER